METHEQIRRKVNGSVILRPWKIVHGGLNVGDETSADVCG
jgi:hypothetical protein